MKAPSLAYGGCASCIRRSLLATPDSVEVGWDDGGKYKELEWVTSVNMED